MKLGVITDGISRDFEHALAVMQEYGLDHAELQFLWEKEVGDLSDAEIGRAQDLVAQYGMTVSCISRHVLAGLPVNETEPGDPAHTSHMEGLKRCIDTAKAFDCSTVRIMSCRKEMILFGSGGAEVWNLAKGAWDKALTLIEPAVRLAEDEGVTLVVETGNGTMITSCALGRMLIDALGSKHLKVLWDPANSLYCNERPFPDAMESLKGGYLGHLHLKDTTVDIPRATIAQVELGTGGMAPYLEDIARALKADGYDGAISFESVYRPEGGTFEDGFRASIGRFKALFA